MPKILCNRPNASQLISGIRFEQGEGGMLSEDVSQEVADRLTGIAGYELVAVRAKSAVAIKQAVMKTILNPDKATEQENDASVEL